MLKSWFWLLCFPRFLRKSLIWSQNKTFWHLVFSQIFWKVLFHWFDSEIRLFWYTLCFPRFFWKVGFSFLTYRKLSLILDRKWNTYARSASLTRIMSSTYSATCRKAFSPAKGGARPPAIDLASGHSTALPAYLIGVNIICKRTYHTSTFKDLYIPQAFSGSTPNTRTLFREKWAKAVATPAKSPPPPQQTRTIVTSGTCWQIS